MTDNEVTTESEVEDPFSEGYFSDLDTVTENTPDRGDKEPATKEGSDTNVDSPTPNTPGENAPTLKDAISEPPKNELDSEQNVNVSQPPTIDDSQIEPIVESLLGERLEQDSENENQNMNTENVSPESLSSLILKRPETVLYGVGLFFVMSSLYFPSPILAGVGVGFIALTILHYGN